MKEETKNKIRLYCNVAFAETLLGLGAGAILSSEVGLKTGNPLWIVGGFVPVIGAGLVYNKMSKEGVFTQRPIEKEEENQTEFNKYTKQERIAYLNEIKTYIEKTDNINNSFQLKKGN